jgi:hypothetical protein
VQNFKTRRSARHVDFHTLARLPDLMPSKHISQSVNRNRVKLEATLESEHVKHQSRERHSSTNTRDKWIPSLPLNFLSTARGSRLEGRAGPATPTHQTGFVELVLDTFDAKLRREPDSDS